MKTKDLTIEDCLRNAFAATLKGDYKERDNWCAMAEKGFDGTGNDMPANTPIPLNMKDITPKYNN